MHHVMWWQEMAVSGIEWQNMSLHALGPNAFKAFAVHRSK